MAIRIESMFVSRLQAGPGGAGSSLTAQALSVAILVQCYDMLVQTLVLPVSRCSSMVGEFDASE